VFSPSNDCPVAAAATKRCAHPGQVDEISDGRKSFFKRTQAKGIDQA